MNTTSDSTQLANRLTVDADRYRMLVEAVSDYSIVLLDTHGIVCSWNKGALQVKGYAADEIIGQYFSCFYPKESIELGWPEHELMVARVEGRFEDEGWRVRKDGSRFWASVTLTALYDDEGHVWGFSQITQDLTERRLYEETLRQSEERFRLLVEGVKDCAIFLLNPRGVISSWNAGAENITGYTAAEIIGKHFSTFYPQESVASKWPEHELEVATADGSFEDEGWRVRKDGTRYWANVLITALHDSEGRLYGFAKVTRDLTQRKRIEALELAEQRMNEFLAMLSHELRNPLAPLRSALSVMNMAPADDPVQAQSRQVIERQVSLMSRLVDDLMDVSRVTAGTIKLQREPVDLIEVIEQAIEVSLPLIEKRAHTLVRNLPAAPVVVEGDRVRLMQVFSNLLNNAAQYTPAAGRIVVALDVVDGAARVRVEDSGEGIDDAMLKDVFSLFVQGERSLDRSEGGLGIGLTLARRLVEMQGGVISATSEGAGKGSEFTVELPVLNAIQAEAGGAVKQVTRSEATAATRKGLSVLLVEDMPDVAEGMEMILKMWGHAVTLATTGLDALDVVQALRPDVVLLDIGLPGMDGYEVARQIRRIPEVRETHLIALTGYGQPKDKEAAFAAGFDHHLVKGESLDGLERLLHRAPE